MPSHEVVATQKKIATMPNYAIWALLKAASEVAAENKDDAKGVAFMNNAVKRYKEDANMTAIDKKVNDALAKHLNSKQAAEVNAFVEMRKNFIAALEQGKAKLDSAKAFFKELDRLYARRHTIIDKEPALANDYEALFKFAHDLVPTLKKAYC